jgi:hypothetical protein
MTRHVRCHVETGVASGVLALSTANCVADDFGGEIVALNLGTGLYFSLRDLSGAVWRDLVAGHPVSDVIAGVSAADARLGAEVGGLIDRLVSEGLLRASETATPPVAALSSADLARSGVTALAFEAFNDMQDLVLTDPIHDVDEAAGWPVRREEI